MVSDHSNHHTQSFGVVLRKNRGHYLVNTGERQILCTLSNRLNKKLIYPTAAPTSLRHRVQKVEEIDVLDPVAIGDQVSWFDSGDGTGMIVEVLPRKNQLSRSDFNQIPTHLEQVIVANIDQVVIVFAAAQPEPRWALLDRYLVSAEIYHLPVIICITKMDLADQANLEEPLALYRQLDYPIILTSSVNGTGIDELTGALQGKTSLLMGKSGVGKTSLLNTLQPDLGLKVQAVGNGEVGKGKHTTTHMEMFPLLGGGIVDSPGMRIFAVCEKEGKDLAWYFREMRPLLGKCRFGASCIHDNEPGCAIKQAVNAGDIDPLRYQSFLKLQAEVGT